MTGLGDEVKRRGKRVDDRHSGELAQRHDAHPTRYMRMTHFMERHMFTTERSWSVAIIENEEVEE